MIKEDKAENVNNIKCQCGHEIWDDELGWLDHCKDCIDIILERIKKGNKEKEGEKMNKKREMRFEDARDIRTLYGWVRRSLLALEGDCYDDIDAWRGMCFRILRAINVLESASTRDYDAGETASSIFWCDECVKRIMTEWGWKPTSKCGGLHQELWCLKCNTKK